MSDNKVLQSLIVSVQLRLLQINILLYLSEILIDRVINVKISIYHEWSKLENQFMIFNDSGRRVGIELIGAQIE